MSLEGALTQPKYYFNAKMQMLGAVPGGIAQLHDYGLHDFTILVRKHG